MNYIRVTKENIDKEHIYCAMSGKQSLAKKERGKCFIEYIPAENAWVPIEADGYFYINCLSKTNNFHYWSFFMPFSSFSLN